jgi:hypothetical protein
MMRPDQLPPLLDALRISIDASGELASYGRPCSGARFEGAPEGVITDSRGRAYLTFGHRTAAARATARRRCVSRFIRTAVIVAALGAALLGIIVAIELPIAF